MAAAVVVVVAAPKEAERSTPDDVADLEVVLAGVTET